MKVLYVQMVGPNLGKYEWVWEEITKMTESKKAKCRMAGFKMTAIIKYKWEWMSLNQIELV